jgi:glycosyltransferase involved in cell wall biosynthesis
MTPTFQCRRPLRLVLVTETFPPEVNGVARTLGRWVDTFRDRGHNVTVIRPRQAGEPSHPAHVLGLPLPFYPRLRFGIASPGRMAALLSRMNADLVHVATEGPLGWAAVQAASRLQVPVASSFHTNFDHYLRHYGVGVFETPLLAYLRWFHNRTGVTLVPSRATQQRLQAAGVHRVAIWSRGVDGEVFHPRFRDHALRSRMGLRPDDILLLYVGRLAVEKNLAALLEAFARLRLLTPEPVRQQLRLSLVGDGPLLASLKAATPPGVILAGELRGTALSRWYASGDVFVFPSITETFGNVVLEAQASGLPVVGFDCPALAERITPGCDGFLVPRGGDLAEVLLPLCADLQKRQRLGRQARLTAESQDWRPIFEELEETYWKLVDQPTLPSPPAPSRARSESSSEVSGPP